MPILLILLILKAIIINILAILKIGKIALQVCNYMQKQLFYLLCRASKCIPNAKEKYHLGHVWTNSALFMCVYPITELSCCNEYAEQFPETTCMMFPPPQHHFTSMRPTLALSVKL